MADLLLVAAWTLVGAVVGTLLGLRTRQLLRAPMRHRPALQLAGPLLTAAMFGVLFWRLDNTIDLLVYSTITASGVPLAIIDTTEQRLPSTVLYPTLGVVAFLLATGAILAPDGPALVRALTAMACQATFYLALALASGGGLGAGDIKLGALLGLALGWASWPALLTATLLGWLLGAFTWLTRSIIRPTPPQSPLPMGSCLLLGALVTIATTPPAN